MEGVEEETTFYEFDYVNFPFPDEFISYDYEYLEREILQRDERARVLKTLIKYFDDCQTAPPKPQGNAVKLHAFSLTSEVPLLVNIFLIILNKLY